MNFRMFEKQWNFANKLQKFKDQMRLAF